MFSSDTTMPGHTRLMSSSLVTSEPSASNSANRRSKARVPSSIGTPSASSCRRRSRTRKRPNSRSALAVARCEAFPPRGSRVLRRLYNWIDIIGSMHSASEASAGIAFGRFLLLPQRRELLADGRPVKLGGRAFDVLMALIEARGAVLSKDALMARVWPDRIVEENNLQWQISALRAAFGADRNLIRTVSGRGYQFTAEIDTVY